MKDQTPLILALDVATPATALDILDETGDALSFIKIGHQLYALGGLPFVREIMNRGYRVFLDLKLHDIPNTVRMAVEVLSGEGLWALTLHCSGGRSMMRAARESYLLSDYTKFGARSNFLHTPIHGLTGIVTDQALGDEAMQILQQDNVKLFLP